MDRIGRKMDNSQIKHIFSMRLFPYRQIRFLS